MAGLLSNLRIIEFAAIGPAPFAAMMLADHGADVIRIERPGATSEPTDILLRSRSGSIMLDLKSMAGQRAVVDLVRSADGLIEGFRPGVMERLGLGPEVLLAERPGLVYGRMTGWGQEGPLAQDAGHDINYIALSGNLHGYGRAGDKPTPAANAVGDFGGGGMMLAFGMVAALLAVRGGAPGQVIDCAMVDGAAVLNAMTWSFFNRGTWRDERGVNLLDTGAPHYDSYETADGKWVSLGALEPQFYARFRDLAGIAEDRAYDHVEDPSRWARIKERLTALFLTQSRAEWCALLESSDACFSPVLSLAEAPDHPHNVARRSFVEAGRGYQPMPAPRFSGFPSEDPTPPREPGVDTETVLAAIGYSEEAILALRQEGALK